MQSAQGILKTTSVCRYDGGLDLGDANSCYLYLFVIFSPFCTYIFLPSLFTPHFLKIADWQSKAQCFLKTFNQRTFAIFQLCHLITHRFLIFFFLIVRLNQKSVKDHIQSTRNNKQSVWQIREIINGNVCKT